MQKTTSIHSTVFTQTLVWYALAFFIPLIFSAPQLIIGTLINTLLFLAAPRMTKKTLIPLLVMPSLGALLHGVLFGPYTPFLLFFLPVIWIGNAVMVSLFLALSAHHYLLRVVVSSIGKYLILSAVASILYRSHIVPSLFLSSMGYIQLGTAILGGIISQGIAAHNVYERR